MKLEKLIKDVDARSIAGPTDRQITDIVFDSRKASEACLFIAVKGTSSDGHDYIPQVIDQGAIAIICEQIPDETPSTVTFIEVENARQALALVAAEWYGHPSRELTLVGVTGTNGKTTIATLLYKVNTGLGYKAGILSTIEIRVNNESFPATHTTPDPIQINSWLRKMVDAGCACCFMEVSSHAVSQFRIYGLQFNGGIFTNLSHDHLDYHKDFASYLKAKKSFFDQLDPEAFALVNAGDRNGKVMIQNSRARKYTYGLGRMADYQGKIIELLLEGMQLQINGSYSWFRLTGKFNALNILAVFGASMLMGHKEEEILQVLSTMEPVEGRFDLVRGTGKKIAIVDYAHTDDALRNVLETIHEVNADGRTIITVVGAGGDRDVSKRPKIGAVAAGMSDRVILTSDNPRSEDPEKILKDIEKGIPAARSTDVLKITDREEAIKTACLLGGNSAIILVAGKGHEKFQVIGTEKLRFDDKEVVKKYINS